MCFSDLSGSRKGFTLIELLVVISIVGLISTASFVAINNARAKARDGQRAANMSQLKKALELFYNANGQTYPVSGTPVAYVCTGANSPVGISTYINPVPVDPIPTKSTIETNCLQYMSDGTNYKIRSTMELDEQSPAQDGGISARWYEVFTPGAQSW